MKPTISDAGIETIHNDITNKGAASHGSPTESGHVAEDKVNIPIRYEVAKTANTVPTKAITTLTYKWSLTNLYILVIPFKVRQIFIDHPAPVAFGFGDSLKSAVFVA